MEIKTAEQMFHDDELVTIPGTHQLYKIVEINLNNGDKITQLVIVKVWMPKYDKDATVVDDIGESSDGRGNDGFGSTGK